MTSISKYFNCSVLWWKQDSDIMVRRCETAIAATLYNKEKLDNLKKIS